MSISRTPPRLVSGRLLGPRTLLYFYRRRLRAYGTQELLAGVGIAAAVALTLSALLAQGSITGSTRRVLRAVVGPANLQLRARGGEGFPQSLLGEVEAIPGVTQTAPLLERSVQVTAPDGRSASVFIAGTDTSLAVLNGLGRTLPLDALQPGKLGLSAQSASALGLAADAPARRVSVGLTVGGVRHRVLVSAVLGTEAAGPLAGAQIGVMPLQSMQALLGQPGAVTRILVHSRPGSAVRVRKALQRIAAQRLLVSGTEEDVKLLEEALRPSRQASTLFAVVGALLGLLLAFNAILLTVPERRQAIADLRLAGSTRQAIVQLMSFQALCLGIGASVAGVAVGYALSRWVFHESTRYLQEAFTLAGGTVVPVRTVLAVALGGVAVTWLACAVPLLGLRRTLPPDAIYARPGVPGNTLPRRWQRSLGMLSVALLVAASVLFGVAPSDALLASVTLALATVCAVPVVFAGVLRVARWASERSPSMSLLALALSGVRGTTVRSLALAATGAVALFGSVSLGGARENLLRGVHAFAHAYAADAPVWVGEPEDNQAVLALSGDGGSRRIAGVAGVRSVSMFDGAFLSVGPRRVWVIARPGGGARMVLENQLSGSLGTRRRAKRLLAAGGWVLLSRQLAEEHHVQIGGKVVLALPVGARSFRVAALTRNFAWPPGVVVMSVADFRSGWRQSSPSALAVTPEQGVGPAELAARIRAALGPTSGLQVLSNRQREASIDTLTGEGLSQLGVISTLLLLAAIIALAAALASSIHQRRALLAGLRLAGAAPHRLRRIMLLEGALMLTAGCVTGAVAGFYGQFVIDSYLRAVTGFPVASAGTSVRPLVVFAVVLATALALVAVPAWLASNVSPALALAEE